MASTHWPVLGDLKAKIVTQQRHCSLSDKRILSGQGRAGLAGGGGGGGKGYPVTSIPPARSSLDNFSRAANREDRGRPEPTNPFSIHGGHGSRTGRLLLFYEWADKSGSEWLLQLYEWADKSGSEWLLLLYEWADKSGSEWLLQLYEWADKSGSEWLLLLYEGADKSGEVPRPHRDRCIFSSKVTAYKCHTV
ncbi:unnamed protein product, partial [Iphiclides podalirius]